MSWIWHLMCSQNSIYHYTDVLHHTLDAMCYLKPYDETLAFALLFHDLGKIQVKTTDSNGKDHFKHHAKVGSELSKELCRRLNLLMNKESGFHSMSYIMTINLPVI